MKTIIFAALFTTPVTWPSVSGHAEAEPWFEPISIWYQSFRQWKKGYKF